MKQLRFARWNKLVVFSLVIGIFALAVLLYELFIATPASSKADLLLVPPYGSTVPVITLTDSGFSPSELTVVAGMSVNIVNNSSTSYTLIGDGTLREITALYLPVVQKAGGVTQEPPASNNQAAAQPSGTPPEVIPTNTCQFQVPFPAGSTYTHAYTYAGDCHLSLHSAVFTSDVTVQHSFGPATLTGRVLDTTNAVLGTEQPIVGAVVSLLHTGFSAVTDSQGYFTLNNLTATGEQVLDIDTTNAQPAPDDSPYAGFREKIVIIAGITNGVDRPFYLPRIDPDSLTPVDPTIATNVENPNLEILMAVPAYTALDEDGSYFTGDLSISDVPLGLAPAALPENLSPGRLITIQPVGVTFDTPVPITFPNEEGLEPGNELDLWSLDPESGSFVVVGTGRVSEDGSVIETIEGGIRAADWHLFLPPATEGGSSENQDNNDPCKKSEAGFGSTLTLHDGCLGTSFVLPAYHTLGENQALTFVYKADRAYPTVQIPFDATILARSAVPDLFSYQLSINGIEMGEEVFVDTSALSEIIDEPLHVTAVSAADYFATGVYRYRVETTSHYPTSQVTSQINGRTSIINEQNGYLGSGWGLAGLQRLKFQNGNEILITEGNGNAQHFLPVLPFVFGGFDAARGGNSSYIYGSYHIALRESLETNFPNVSYKPFPLLTTEVLTNVNILMISSVRYPNPEYTTLSPSEQMVLRDFVQDGNCAVLLPDNSIFGGSGTPAANESFIDPFEMDITGNINGTTFASINNPQLSPITNGRFGVVTQFSQGFPGGIVNLGPYAISLADNAIGTALALIRPGKISNNSGPVIIYSDHGTFASLFSTNENLFLNTIDYCLNNINLPPVTEFQSPSGNYSTLVKNEDGTFTRRMKDGTEYQFNALGLQTAVSDPNGNTTSYEYDENGRLITITDPVGFITSLSYSGNLLHSVTDPVGRTTLFTHDAAGNLITVTFPDGSSRSFAYDSRHLMTSETDERGYTTTRTYNEYGQVVAATLPDGTLRQTSAGQSAGIPPAGQGTAENPAPVVRPEEAISSLIDGENHTTMYLTGAFGEATQVVNPAGFTTTIERDADGNPIQTTLPSGAVFNRTFDDQGNLLTITDLTVNGTTSFTYDDTFNQVTSITDDFNHTTTFGYDAFGNLTQVTTPLNRTVTVAYNNLGLPTSLVDPLGTQTTFAYDANGRLTQTAVGEGAAQRVAALTYTPAGYIATLTDPLTRQSSFSYDVLGRLTSETLPGDRTITYQYDAAGNLTALTPPGRPAHTFGYNQLGLVTAYIPPVVAGSGSNQTLYSYNHAQELTQIARPDGVNVLFGYDENGRLQTITLPRGSLTYGYSPTTGQLTTLAAPGNVNLAYSYNDELLTQVAWSGAVAGTVGFGYDASYRLISTSVNGSPISYQYDADNALTQAGSLAFTYHPTTGLLTNGTLGSVSSSWGYNEFAELTSHTAAYNSSNLYATTYERDKIGRITSKTETIGGVTTIYTYLYDAAGRLNQVQENGLPVATYTYDPNGNRLSYTDASNTTLTASYDDQDRLLQYGDTSYTYTANGELLTQTTAGQTITYTYDELGNLLGVSLPDGRQITYLVDGQNRRIGKQVDGTLTHSFLYQDDLKPIAELDGSGVVISRFVYGNQVNVPEYLIRGGSIYRLITDHLGSVRLVVDTQTGAIAQRLGYDAWGQVTQDTNPGFQPFGFAGGLYDPDTGLVRFGVRDYAAQIGRWTAKDPIGFEGGNANLYLYVGGDPINFVDPSGNLLIWPILRGAIFEAAFNYLEQGFTKGFDCIDYKEVVFSAFVGATSSIVGEAATHFLRGRIISGILNNKVGRAIDETAVNAIGGAVSGGISEFGEQVYKGGEINTGEIGLAIFIGSIGGMLDRVGGFSSGTIGTGLGELGATVTNGKNNCICQ